MDAMTFSVSYDQENDCVIGGFTGVFDWKTAALYAEAITDTASKHDCTRFLNDMRQAELALSTSEIFRIRDMLDTAGVDSSWKRAIVAARDLEDYRFFETVALNRGYGVRIFTDPIQAMSWLTKTR